MKQKKKLSNSFLFIALFLFGCSENYDKLSASATTKKCFEAFNAQKFTEVKALTTDESNDFIDLYKLGLLSGKVEPMEIFSNKELTFKEEAKDEKETWVSVLNKNGEVLAKLLVIRVEKHWEVNLSADALTKNVLESTKSNIGDINPDDLLEQGKDLQRKADSIKNAMKKEFGLTDEDIDKLNEQMNKLNK